MEYCDNSKYKTTREACVELEKYVDASDHHTESPDVFHLGSLPQTAGWIDWLQFLQLLHGMMVCSTVVEMCLELGVEDNVDQVTSHLVNNTAMQFSDAFLLDYDEEDPIGRMVSIE